MSAFWQWGVRIGAVALAAVGVHALWAHRGYLPSDGVGAPGLSVSGTPAVFLGVAEIGLAGTCFLVLGLGDRTVMTVGRRAVMIVVLSLVIVGLIGLFGALATTGP